MTSFALARMAPLALLALVTVRTAPAQAAPSRGLPVRIDYTAPPNCPSREMFFTQVADRAPDVQLAAEGENATLVKVDVTTSDSAEPFQARLALTSEAQGAPERSERVLTGRSCADVVRAVAFIVSVFVVERAPHVEEPPPLPPPQSPPPNEPDRASTPSSHRASTAILLSGGMRNGFGDVLGPSASIAVERFEEGSWLAPSIRPSLTFASVVQHAGNDRMVGRLFIAAVDGCAFRLGRDAIGVSPCLRLEGGVAHADNGPSSIVAPWLAPGALARLRSHIGGLVTELDAGVVVPLFVNRFHAYTPPTPSGANRVASSPIIATELAVSVGWGF